ncbi:MAG: hypothetical protein K2X69_05920 [Silvanigrellaceae bacterium]|nr:hypothetical protein [Silvanigrellaceae bacterium]
MFFFIISIASVKIELSIVKFETAFSKCLLRFLRLSISASISSISVRLVD